MFKSHITIHPDTESVIEPELPTSAEESVVKTSITFFIYATKNGWKANEIQISLPSPALGVSSGSCSRLSGFAIPQHRGRIGHMLEHVEIVNLKISVLKNISRVFRDRVFQSIRFDLRRFFCWTGDPDGGRFGALATGTLLRGNTEMENTLRNVTLS